MFGHKKVYKVTNLKVHSKGRYFIFLKSLFKNYNERLIWTTKLFSCICDITKINIAYRNSNGWQVGRTLVWALHVSNWNPVRVFLYDCIFWWKPTVFRKLWMSFSFHLAYNVIKQFVSRALLCVQCYRGNLALSTTPTAPPAGREWICIYMRPQIV